MSFFLSALLQRRCDFNSGFSLFHLFCTASSFFESSLLVSSVFHRSYGNLLLLISILPPKSRIHFLSLLSASVFCFPISLRFPGTFPLSDCLPLRYYFFLYSLFSMSIFIPCTQKTWLKICFDSLLLSIQIIIAEEPNSSFYVLCVSAFLFSVQSSSFFLCRNFSFSFISFYLIIYYIYINFY